MLSESPLSPRYSTAFAFNHLYQSYLKLKSVPKIKMAQKQNKINQIISIVISIVVHTFLVFSLIISIFHVKQQ